MKCPPVDPVTKTSPQKNKGLEAAFKLTQRAGLVLVASFIILFLFGPSIPSSGVGELERSILELNGFLLAFVGIVFTGMVAEVRMRTDLGPDKQRRLSKTLRWEALGSFLTLMFSLITSIIVTVLALAPPWNVTIPVALAEIFPLSFTIMGLALLAYALAEYATMDSIPEGSEAGEPNQPKLGEETGELERGSVSPKASPASSRIDGSIDDDEKYKRTLDSEKSRVVIWLALLAIVASARVGLPPGSFWNFPCNSPCTHITIFLGPLYDTLILLWLCYAGCMLVYFSEDWFYKYRRGRTVREVFRRVGNRVFLYLYPLTVAFFTTAGAGSFQLPPSIQGPYWVGAAGIFGFLVIWSAEGVIGQPILGPKGMLSKVIDRFLEVGREGGDAVGERLVQTWRKFQAGDRSRASEPALVKPNSKKRANRLLLIGILVVTVGSAWRFWNLPVADLWLLFTGTLYAVLFALLAIGLLKRRG